MNAHTKSLLERVLSSINLYEQRKMNEKELMQDIEGTCGAIEEHDIQSQLNSFVVKIEESLYLYDVAEGKKFLLEEIQKIKDSLLEQLN
ncbi:hypothetical protein SPSYN_03149 [Sporotomaculum syntrophicum]|uniref:Uncharacterized protein n=1 Tax=Sporotomaculum syntrophicum TaxID=182264 RepID=A0A9D2WNE9_9FIRM|nr:hypothetical protein [Sporotomaculum syntrophicum]KAF1083692.1 hypothetical protein SPSYN_03149 [Sporotomaculum syntrophicum]